MTLEPFIEVILQIWSINEKWVVPNTCDQRIYVTLDAHRKWLFGKTFTVWVRVCCYFFFSSHSSPYLNASIVPFSINQWKLFSVVYWNANYYTKRPMYMLNDWYLMWGGREFLWIYQSWTSNRWIRHSEKWMAFTRFDWANIIVIEVITTSIFFICLRKFTLES